MSRFPANCADAIIDRPKALDRKAEKLKEWLRKSPCRKEDLEYFRQAFDSLVRENGDTGPLQKTERFRVGKRKRDAPIRLVELADLYIRTAYYKDKDMAVGTVTSIGKSSIREELYEDNPPVSFSTTNNPSDFLIVTSRARMMMHDIPAKGKLALLYRWRQAGTKKMIPSAVLENALAPFMVYLCKPPLSDRHLLRLSRKEQPSAAANE